MKKFVLFVLVFACFILGGCRNSASKADEALLDEGKENPSISVKPAPQTLTEPPELIVSTMYDTDSVTASCGNYEWNRELPDGTTGHIIACGAHPLDVTWEYNILYTAFPAGSLPPLEEGQMPGMLLPIFYLNFGNIPPDVVSVQRWPASYIGDAQIHSADSEDVAVESENGIFTLLPLGDGDFIYEIHVEWSDVGSANYVFRTLPQVRGAETEK